MTSLTLPVFETSAPPPPRSSKITSLLPSSLFPYSSGVPDVEKKQMPVLPLPCEVTVKNITNSFSSLHGLKVRTLTGLLMCVLYMNFLPDVLLTFLSNVNA
ncbi:unnamed protein product [Leuciscus chuanchicus]